MADTLLTLVEKWRTTLPDKIAYRFLADGETVTSEFTYGGLGQEIDRQAAAIAGRCRPGDRVGLIFSSSLEFVPAFIAVLKAGCVAVPLAAPTAPGASSGGLTALLADAEPSLVISNVGHELAEVQMPSGCHLAGHDDIGTETAVPQRAVAGSDLAFLQYTSGSTGRPKGVMVTHANIMANQRQMMHAFGQGESAIVVSWLPLYHDMGLIGAVLHPLYLGGSAVLMAPESFVKEPRRWLQAISRYRATISVAPNFGYELCLAKISVAYSAELDLSSWQVAVNGSEPIRPAVLAGFAKAFGSAGFQEDAAAPCYGLAESTLLVTSSTRRIPRVDGVVSCGRWSPDSEVVIVADGQELPAGREGEIWVRSASVAAGYWRKPGATDETFGARLEGDDRVFLRTGDLGKVIDGELYITGRLDDLMVIRGRNHHPQDIEDTVSGVHRVLARGSTAAFLTDAGMVVVQGVRGRVTAEEDVVAKINAAIAREHGLAAADVVLVPAGAIPKTSSGKIKRSACRERYLAGGFHRAAAGGESSSTPTSLGLAVAEILGTSPERLRPDAALASLGLDSLRALKLQHHLSETAGVDASLEMLLNGACLSDLEGLLRSAASAGEAGSARAEGTRALAAPHEMSRGQQALWVLSRDNAGAARAYTLSRALELDGDLDEDLLETACAALVRRHPQLRGRIVEQAGQPRIETCAVEDHTWFTVRDAGTDLTTELAAEAGRPVNLARDPLFRMVLFRGSRPTLLFVAAHLICDLHSLSVVLTELGEILAGGQSPPSAGDAEDEVSSIRRAIATEREFLASTRGEQALRQWADELADVEPLVLPGNRERTAGTRCAGSVLVLELGKETAGHLRHLTQRLDCTPFAVLLGAYHAFLARICGTDDIVIGVPSSTRSDPGLEGAVGYFINMVPVRVDASSSSSEKDTGTLCARVRVAAAAMARSLDRVRLPLPDLVRHIGVSGDPWPIFGVSAGYYDSPTPGVVCVGLEVASGTVPIGPLVGRPHPLPEPGAVTGLDVNFGLVDGSLVLRVNYSTEIFDDPTARQLAASLATFVSGVLREPDADFAAAPLSRDGLAVIEPDPLTVPALSLADLFDRQATGIPDNPAVVYGTRTLTYAELERWSRHLAGQMLETGNGLGRVALAFGGEPRFVVGMIAALRAGAAFLPMMPDLPEERLRAMLADSRPELILAPPENREWLTRLATQAGSDSIVIGVNEAPSDGGQGTALPARPPHSVAYVVHTSGTTGRPKGVVIRDDTVTPLLRWQEREFGAGPGMRMAQTCSLSFDVGIQELFTVLFFGGTICIPLPAERYSARDFGAFIARDRVNALYATPTFIRDLAAHDVPMPTVQVVQIAGELLFSDVVERIRPLFGPGCRIYNGYGPAETSINCAMHLVEPTGTKAGSVLPVGRATGLARLYVLDRYLRPLPSLLEGEIYVGGPGVGDGYLKQPEETAARFVPDTVTDTGRMYRTGDRGRVLADGSLMVSGRLDDQVKIRGYRVEPAEVEAQLRKLVDDCAVVVDRSRGNPRLLAFVAGRDIGLARLHAELSNHLPSYMIPARLIPATDLPRTRNGKLDVTRLVALAGADEPVSAGGRMLPLIAEIWSRELGLEHVNPDENFFDIGGSSLSLTKVAVELSQAASLDIQPPLLYRYPTARLLAAYLEALTEDSSPASTPVSDISALTPGPGNRERLAVARRVRGRQATQSRIKET